MKPRPVLRCRRPGCALLGLLMTAAAAAAPPFEQPRSLGFLQQRGGIAAGDPYRKGNRWLLPVTCNVSGIATVTTTPTVIHSGLAWSKTLATVEDGRIFITVLTAQQGPEAPSAQCGPARLRRFYDHRYEVWYRDPDGTEHWLRDVDTAPR